MRIPITTVLGQQTIEKLRVAVILKRRHLRWRFCPTLRERRRKAPALKTIIYLVSSTPAEVKRMKMVW